MKRFFTLFAALLCMSSMWASVTLKVDDASKVKVMDGNYSYLTLQNGDNTVDAGTYMIQPSDYNYAINKVLLNGEEKSATYGYWSVSTSDGDVLEIKALYEQDAYAVTVTAPEGSISKVETKDGTVGEISVFEAPAGYSITITPNTNGWNIQSIKVNGVAQSYYSGSLTLSIKEATNIVVEATEKSSNSITFNVSDPAGIEVYGAKYNSYYDSSCPITIDAVETTVKLAEDYTYVAIKKVSGYVISAVSADGVEIDDNYGVYYAPIHNGSLVNVAVSAIVKDQTATVVVKDMSAANYGFTFQNADRETITLTEGGNTVQFATTYNPFSLSMYGSDIAPVVYNKGVKVAPYYEGGTSYQFNLADGDYLEVFVKGGDSEYGVTGISDGEYLIKHAATGKYLGGANDWGTHASLVPHGQIWTATVLENGKYMLDSHTYNNAANHYLGSDYVDNAGQAMDIVKTQGGYTISPAEGQYVAAGEGTYVGTGAANADVWELVSYSKAVAALAQASEENPMDATFMIKAANFSRNHYNASFEPAWTVEAGCTNYKLNGGSNDNNCAESWHSGFNIHQVIEVPNGKYTLKAQGFYRQDGNDNENLPVFYANGQTATFPSKTGSESSMADASASFSNGLYTIEPISVVVTDGKLDLGVKNENLTIWCIWDNFELSYQGAQAPVVKVDDATKVKMMNQNDYSYVSLVNGENTVDAVRYMICSADYNYTLNKIELNGEEVAGSYGYWYVTLKAGDVLDIKALYEAESYAVTIEAPAGTISSVTTKDGTVGEYAAFEAPAGYAITITPNTSAWNIKSVKVNGEALSYYSGSIDVTIKGATSIVIEAEEKSAKQFTLNVTDPAAIKAYGAMYSSYYDSNCPLELTSTSNTLTLSDDYGYVAITKNAGYYITSVKVDGTVVSDNYGTYYAAVTNGCVVEVECGEIVKDQTATIVVKDMEAANYGFYMQNADRETITLTEGENTLQFATAYNPFNLGIYGSDIAPVVYINGEVKNPAYEGSTSYELTLANGDYVEIFVKGGESQYTGIETLSTNNQSVIFNLDGQRLNAAQKGMNIINGKKVIIK